MKKAICILSALSLLCLVGCDVNEMSSLKDISKPYAAEYTCDSLTFGNEEMIENYKSIKLDMRASGDFTLKYRDLNGGEGSYQGNYTFGEDSVTFECPNGGTKSTFTFPYEKGTIYLELPLAGKVLKAKFEA